MIANISIVKPIDAPSGKVWAAIRNIDGLDRWFPVIESCRVEGEGVGVIRILGLGDGAEIRDRIEEIDDHARCFRYLRTHHPFPISSYRGKVSVRDAGDGKSEVTWAVVLDVAADARNKTLAFLGAVLSAGISGLEQDLQPERRAS
jgi:hypothetical protein